MTPTDTSVSMVAAPCRALTIAARWNGHAPHTATGEASASGRPLPVPELQCRDHRQCHYRDGQRRRYQQPLPQRGCLVGTDLIPRAHGLLALG